MHAVAVKSSNAQDSAVTGSVTSQPALSVAPEQTPLWAQAGFPLQTKLAINRPGNRYEQEADRVADQVMRMPASRAQRKTCSCGKPAGPDGMCEACKRKKLGIQRMTSGDSPQTTAPPIVHQVLQQPGRPLDSTTRNFMESRFGQGFDGVRVHAGGEASESAEVVNAKAYTVGQNVVFGQGKYRPGTVAGRRLLAHELTHVVQQRRGAAPAVRRQTRVSVQIPPNTCRPNQTREVIPAVTEAQRWLRVADTQLTAYSAAVGRPGGAGVALSLRRHFAATGVATGRYIQNRIRLIADRLRTDPGAPSPLTVQCHGASDRNCGAAAAYVQGQLLVFCPSFFGSNRAWQVMAMIHEIAHSLPSATGSLHITDRAYRGDRLYGSLTPGEALTNAESYAMLIRELATGRIGGAAPRDTYEDCPRDWRGALHIAVARAQRWNRDAQNILRDRRPGMLTQWAALATTNLGGQSPAQLSAAQSAYDQAETRLHRTVDFECEADGGGRCDNFATYWYAAGDFHICPSWRSLPTDEDRAQALLRGLYGYFGISDSGRRRANLARLARALHFQFWAAPSAADITSALSAAQTQPQPPAAPPAGPVPVL